MHAVERIVSATPIADPNNHYIANTPDDLYHLTLEGWEVVERFEIDVPIPLTEQIMPVPQQGYQSPPQELKHMQLGKRAYFRLRKNEETIVVELNDRIVKLQSERAFNQQKLDDLEKEAEKLKAEIAQVQSRLKGSQDNYEALRKQKEQVEQIKRQLEGDIGKIREHIGKKTMDEVLGKKVA